MNDDKADAHKKAIVSLHYDTGEPAEITLMKKVFSAQTRPARAQALAEFLEYLRDRPNLSEAVDKIVRHIWLAADTEESFEEYVSRIRRESRIKPL